LLAAVYRPSGLPILFLHPHLGLYFQPFPLHLLNPDRLGVFGDNRFKMGRLYTFNLALFAATGSFLFGYDSGVMTDVIASPNFLAYFDTTKTSAIIGAINSTFSGGGMFCPPPIV
jgi:hypothetical protein